MPCLNLDLDYFNHPKTMRLVSVLGKGSEVLPLKLWCYCGKFHSENGKLIGYSASELEFTLGWWGKEGELINALIKVELLEKIENGFRVHDWTKHEGHLKSFKERASKAAQIRWKKIKCSKHATSMLEPCLTNAPAVPNQTVPTKPTTKKESKKEKPENGAFPSEEERHARKATAFESLVNGIAKEKEL